MSLIKDSNNAERSIGCYFAERFETQASVEDNGGIITGTPTFSGEGMLCESGDVAIFSCDTCTGEKVSIVFKFNPSFEADDDINHGLWSTENDTYRFYKHAGTVGNKLYFVAQTNVVIATVLLVDYQPYWKTNEDNVFVLTLESGDTDIWLNGNKILSDRGTAITTDNFSKIAAGLGSISGVGTYVGSIKELKVFNRKISDEEALLYSLDNIGMSYEKDALLNYITDNNTAELGKIVDISGNGLDLTTTGTVAKVSDGWGYDLCGADNYGITVPITGTFDTITFSYWANSCDVGGQTPFSFEDPLGNVVFMIQHFFNGIYFYSGSSSTPQASSLTRSNLINRWVHVVGQFDGTDCKIWVDGERGANASTPLPPSTNYNSNSYLTIGSRSNLLSNYNGKIARVKMWDSVLTELQIQDLYSKELKSINRIQ